MARIIIDFLRQHNMKTIRWSSLNPAGKPIEQLWDETQRRLNHEAPRPTARLELDAVFLSSVVTGAKSLSETPFALHVPTVYSCLEHP